MSATIARQGGRVEQEQSNTGFTLNMAKMAKVGFSNTNRGDKQYLNKKHCTIIEDKKKWGDEFPRN
jgi:hypothetical protein